MAKFATFVALAWIIGIGSVGSALGGPPAQPQQRLPSQPQAVKPLAPLQTLQLRPQAPAVAPMPKIQITVNPTPGVSASPNPANAPIGIRSPSPGSADDDPSAELLKIREEQVKAYGSINSSNPLSGDFNALEKLPKDGPFAKLNAVLSNPAVQAYLKFFSNPAFSDGMSKIVQSPNRMTLLYAEVGLFLFMIIFRAWRFAKADHWAKKLWINVWTFGLGIVLSAALPVVLIDGYLQTIQGLFEYFTK